MAGPIWVPAVLDIANSTCPDAEPESDSIWCCDYKHEAWKTEYSSDKILFILLLLSFD